MGKTFAEVPALQIHSRHNNVMHAKSGLRVLLEWKIYRPDSVITAVITLRMVRMQFELRTLIEFVTATQIWLDLYFTPVYNSGVARR